MEGGNEARRLAKSILPNNDSPLFPQEAELKKLASPPQDKKDDSGFEWKAAIENYYHYYYNKKFHYNKFGIDKRLLEESQDKLYSHDFKESHDLNDLRAGLFGRSDATQFNGLKKPDAKLIDDQDDRSEEESIVKKLGTPPQSEDELNESMLDEHEDRLEIDEEEDFDLEDELGSESSENSEGKRSPKAPAISAAAKLQINRDVSHLDENANCHLSKEESSIGQRKIWNPLHCASKYDQYRAARLDENSQSTVGTTDCASSLTAASNGLNQNSSRSCSIVQSELAKLLLAPVTSANSSTTNGQSITSKASLQSSTKTLPAQTNSSKPLASAQPADSQWLNFSAPLSQPDAYAKQSQLLHSALTGEQPKLAGGFLGFEPFTGSYSTSIKPDDSSLYTVNSQHLLNLETKFSYPQTPASALDANFSPALSRAQQVKTVAKGERRRIYKCNYDNCTKKYFKSSHLKGAYPARRPTSRTLANLPLTCFLDFSPPNEQLTIAFTPARSRFTAPSPAAKDRSAGRTNSPDIEDCTPGRRSDCRPT